MHVFFTMVGPVPEEHGGVIKHKVGKPIVFTARFNVHNLDRGREVEICLDVWTNITGAWEPHRFPNSDYYGEDCIATNIFIPQFRGANTTDPRHCEFCCPCRKSVYECDNRSNCFLNRGNGTIAYCSETAGNITPEYDGEFEWKIRARLKYVDSGETTVNWYPTGENFVLKVEPKDGDLGMPPK